MFAVGLVCFFATVFLAGVTGMILTWTIEASCAEYKTGYTMMAMTIVGFMIVFGCFSVMSFLNVPQKTTEQKILEHQQAIEKLRAEQK